MTGPIRRVAVLRALQLGDMLCAVPALHRLRLAYPDANIELIGLPWATELVRRFPSLLNGAVAFPGYPGIPEAPFEPARTLTFLQQCQAEPYDLVVQLHGNGTILNAFVALLGAKRIAGFCPPNETLPSPDFLPYPAHGHESQRLLALAGHLGWPEAHDAPSFPIRPGDTARCRALLRDHGLEAGSYAVIHAGARDPARRWSAASFAAVADSLAATGLHPVLTGTADELDQVAAVAAAMRSEPAVLCGRTDLGALAALLAASRLLVANDTGVAHLAAALHVPSIVVFTRSDPDRWAPLERDRHRVFVEPTALVNNCCASGDDHACLGDACRRPAPIRRSDPVDLGQVIAAALELASAERSHVPSR